MACIGLRSKKGIVGFYIGLDRNFKLFGLIYWLYNRKFDLSGARLLKKRVGVSVTVLQRLGLGRSFGGGVG